MARRTPASTQVAFAYLATGPFFNVRALRRPAADRLTRPAPCRWRRFLRTLRSPSSISAARVLQRPSFAEPNRLRGRRDVTSSPPTFAGSFLGQVARSPSRQRSRSRRLLDRHKTTLGSRQVLRR